MATRKRIALIFSVNKNWMGGTYYVLNLICALGTLPEEDRPEIVLLCKSDSDFDYAVEYSGYPLLKKRLTFAPSKEDLFIRIANKLCRMVIGHNLFFQRIFNEKVDAIYPVMNYYQLKSASPLIYWIPDLQEHFLPHFFSKDIIIFRNRQIKELINANKHIIFSSYDSLNSFNSIYPEGQNLKKSVLHFAVKPLNTESSKNMEILKKFNVEIPFFYCANQFWAHKNHKTLIDAVKLLKDTGYDVTVLCSGATTDYRNPEYFPKLKKYVEENGLQNNVRFLGFINREEQITLMQECLAIIQPSLFEGWSTSVEEAKSMNKYLVLSDIPLHREQAPVNSSFFSPDNPQELADTIKDIFCNKPTTMEFDYRKTIEDVARSFMNIISK